MVHKESKNIASYLTSKEGEGMRKSLQTEIIPILSHGPVTCEDGWPEQPCCEFVSLEVVSGGLMSHIFCAAHQGVACGPICVIPSPKVWTMSFFCFLFFGKGRMESRCMCGHMQEKAEVLSLIMQVHWFTSLVTCLSLQPKMASTVPLPSIFSS